MSSRKRRIKLYQQYMRTCPNSQYHYRMIGLLISATRHAKRQGYLQRTIDRMNAWRRSAQGY